MVSSTEIVWDDPKKIGTSIVRLADSACMRYEDVIVGSDAVFVGFPSSLQTFFALVGKQPESDPIQPLFRKGLIAGKNEVKRTIILDGRSLGGHSGSPVFNLRFEPPNVIHFGAVGVISKFLPDVAVSKNERGFVTNVSYENSGYAVVEPMDALLDDLKRIRLILEKRFPDRNKGAD